MTAHARNASIGLGAGLLLTFLFIQQRPVDPLEHDRFVHTLEEMQKTAAGLRVVPSFIGGRKKDRIEQLLKRESDLLAKKTRLVEDFKSENAILKNSLRYFPVSIAEASAIAAKTGGRQVHDRLGDLLRDVLIYDLTPHSDLTGALHAEIALLSGDTA